MAKFDETMVDTEGLYNNGYFRSDLCGFHWQQCPPKPSPAKRESKRTQNRNAENHRKFPDWNDSGDIAPEPLQTQYFHDLWYLWRDMIVNNPEFSALWHDYATTTKAFNLKAESTGLQDFDYFVHLNLPRLMKGEEWYIIPCTTASEYAYASNPYHQDEAFFKELTDTLSAIALLNGGTAFIKLFSTGELTPVVGRMYLWTLQALEKEPEEKAVDLFWLQLRTMIETQEILHPPPPL